MTRVRHVFSSLATDKITNMDIITQGLLGANLALSGSRQSETRVAAVFGFMAGLLADADILIRSSTDPLLTIEYHRHFTHSIFFVPIGALIAALILWPFVSNRIRFSRVYLYSLLGYSLSGFLDACTSYGTHLFWPLTTDRIAFNVISIIDPLFTGLLLISMIVAIRKGSAQAAKIGLLLAGCYLLFGWHQHERAVSVARGLATERGHLVERLLVKPTLGNLVLWRSIYQSDGMLYVDGVRVGLLAGDSTYQGQSIRLFILERDLEALSSSSLLHKDIRRFIHFSDGFVALHSEHPDRLGDIRYAGLPTSLTPLWVISFDRNKPQSRASFDIIRAISEEDRKWFVSMLFNGDGVSN